MKHSDIILIFESFGYHHEEAGHFIKHRGQAFATLIIRETGISIKVYGSGYAESDFISSFNLTPENLLNWLKFNSI